MSATDSATDPTLSPHEAMRLVEREQRAHDARVAAPVPAILLTWGIAWPAIYLLLWAGGWALPLAPAVAAAAVVLLVAVVLSAVLGARTGRGIRPTADTVFTGTVYGVSWTLGILALAGIGWGLVVNGMPTSLVLLYAAVAYAFLSGFQFVIAAAIWHAVPSLVLGVWIVALAVAAAFLGTPAGLLLLAIGGGLPLLGLAIAQTVRSRRATRAASAS